MKISIVLDSVEELYMLSEKLEKLEQLNLGKAETEKVKPAPEKPKKDYIWILPWLIVNSDIDTAGTQQCAVPAKKQLYGSVLLSRHDLQLVLSDHKDIGHHHESDLHTD